MFRKAKIKIWNQLGINKIIVNQEIIKTKLDSIERNGNELIKATVFNSTIVNSPWLKYQNFSPGVWAVDYAFLYTLYRVLDDIKPVSILEFGLGQSSKLIHQFAAYNKSNAITYEHDIKWLDYFMKSVKNKYNLNVFITSLEYINFNGVKTLSYKDNCSELKGNQYDLIVVDAPFGSERYSRPQILNILPNCLNKSFCIIFDDCNRDGEMETLTEIFDILRKNDIKFLYAKYSGNKTHYLICSEDYTFLTTF